MGLFRLAMLVLIIYLAMVGTVFLLQDRIIFQPWEEVGLSPADLGLDFQEVELTCRDGVMISGWFIPHERPDSDRVLLFFHGNAGNMSHRLDSLLLFHELGLSVMIIDYRGYGNSSGSPSEKGIYLDGLAAWEYLVLDRNIEPTSIVILGRSLGGAVASRVASLSHPAGLVLESTFPSATVLGRELFPFLPVGLLLKHRFDLVSSLSSIACPVLVIHSSEDDMIPFALGRQLYEVIPSEKTFLAIRGDHNTGFLQSREEYLAGIEKFLEKVLGKNGERDGT